MLQLFKFFYLVFQYGGLAGVEMKMDNEVSKSDRYEYD